MPIPETFGFYAILTNPLRGYDYCTHILVDCEVAFVQLRMKDVPEAEVLKTAELMRKITQGSKTKLIINDSPAIAKQVGADGVHIGQSDMSYEEARTIVGENAIIGISTHSVEQVKETCDKKKPDYVGMGPVYVTPTKKNPDPVIGLHGLKDMLAVATVPAVAIGGITLETLPLVLECGARNFCMVRPITMASDPERVVKEIQRVYKAS
jgi:thiamine-phosphate pyrophosphorylase